MKKGYIFSISILLVCLLLEKKVYAQSVEVIKSDQLFQKINDCSGEDIKVFNFWATWCAPCIRELPQFDSLKSQFGNVDVNLISIDDVDLLDKKVKPFIRKRAISSNVFLLDETDFNELINSIDPEWSGAIPATLIINCKNKKRYFFEKEFKEGELTKTIENIINQP